jgi:hypothetical protein
MALYSHISFAWIRGHTQGAKPALFPGLIAWAQAQAYLRSRGKNKGNSRFLPLRLRSGCGMTNERAGNYSKRGQTTTFDLVKKDARPCRRELDFILDWGR